MNNIYLQNINPLKFDILIKMVFILCFKKMDYQSGSSTLYDLVTFSYITNHNIRC